jgi:hypothetical protein
MDVSLGDSRRGDWVAWLLHRPLGRSLAGAAGLIVVVGGLVQVVRSWKRGFRQHFDMGERTNRLMAPVMRFGLIARGLVSAGIGVSIVVATLQVDVEAVRGLRDILDFIQRQSYGAVLLGLMALGLIAFGVSNLIQSIWRRIEAPS